MNSVSIDQLVQATGGTATGLSSTDSNINAVSIDSRTIAAGQLFWALQGDRFDGHNFVENARARGAVASVVQRGKADDLSGPRIEVNNTLEALGQFASWYREQQDALLIGVTGSYGKTTTRSMIHSVLSAAFNGCQSPKNFNNHFGVPLSLLEIEADHEFAVLEFGASAIGEIRELAQIAGPEIGVITGIGPAHLDGFGTEENIIQAKGELLEAIPASGFAVLAADDQRVAQMASRCSGRVITVGEQPHHDLSADSVRIDQNGLHFTCDGHDFHVQVAGRHFLTAALVAIAIGREVGVSPDAMQLGMRQFQPISGRCEVRQVGPWTVIDDTYNSNPTSMSAACRTLQDWQTNGNKILVTGDMLALGSNDVKYHRQLGAQIAKSGIQRVLTFGQYADVVANSAIEAGMPSHNVAEAEHIEILNTVLDCWLEPGDTVLVKGSRGMRMERVMTWLESLAATSNPNINNDLPESNRLSNLHGNSTTPTVC